MALLWADGFDWVDLTLNADAVATDLMTVKSQRRGFASSGPSPNFVNYVPGRGGRGGALNWDNTSSYFSTPVLRNANVSSPLIWGFAYKPLTSFVDNNAWMYLNLSTDIQCSLRYETSDNSIRLFRGTGTLVATSPGNLIDLGVWQYLEFKIHVDDTAGYIVMRKNGIIVWESATNLDTKDIGGFPEGWNSLRMDPNRFGNNCNVDDMYICDETGTANNDFLGDIAVDTLKPIADGSFTAWSKSGAGDHYEMIDDVPYLAVPDDTDYVETDVINETELFEFENMPVTVPKATKVYGVASFPILKCSDGANPPRMVNVARGKDLEATGGNFNNWSRTDLFASDAKEKVRHDTDYFAQGNLFETEPRTGRPWTVEDVNQTQFGVRYLG